MRPVRQGARRNCVQVGPSRRGDGADPVPAQNPPHRRRRDLHAEVAALTHDSQVTPARVLANQPQHQLGHLLLQPANNRDQCAEKSSGGLRGRQDRRLRRAGPGCVRQADTHLQVADPAEAIRCFRQALTLFREFRDPYAEASTLVHLGASATSPATTRPPASNGF
jgi:hypothetical protein